MILMLPTQTTARSSSLILNSIQLIIVWLLYIELGRIPKDIVLEHLIRVVSGYAIVIVHIHIVPAANTGRIGRWREAQRFPAISAQGR
jgi:hypothetical protein